MTETTLQSVHPRYLVSRIADSATVLNDIQDTTAGDSFSIATGYPEKYALPFDKGGKPLNRAELNNVFNLLSQLHFYWQMGGVPVWDRRVATGEGSFSTIGGYPRNARVFKMVDNNLMEFVSKVDNNSVEPTSAATDYWTLVTLSGDVATKEYVDSSIATLSGNAALTDSSLKNQIDSLSNTMAGAVATLSGNAQTMDTVLSGQIVELSGAISGIPKGVKVLNVESNKSSVQEILEETGHSGETFNQGDVLIVTGYDEVSGTRTLTTKTSYVYGTTDWIACCGHSIDASKVFTSASIDLAGEYTRVGNLTKSSTSETVKNKFPKNTSIQQIISNLLDVSVVPTVYSTPTNSVTLYNGSTSGAKAGEFEVGTEFTPYYKVEYTDGKFVCAGAYTAAGCPNNGRTVTDGSHSASAQEGTIYEKFTVGDGTNGGVNNYSVSAITNYGDSTVVPKDNKGVEHSEVKITGSSTPSKGSGTVNGIRYMFWGMNASDDEITAANATTIVRGLMSLNHYRKAPASTDEFAISTADSPLRADEVTNAKRCIIAIPASVSRGPKTVTMPSSQQADITDEFKPVGTFSVEGANGYPGIQYRIWVYKPASLSNSETYAITIGQPKNP